MKYALFATLIALATIGQTVIDDGVSRRLTLQKGSNIVRAAAVNAGGATDSCARFVDTGDKLVKGITVDLSEVCK
jgi:hypothetical protein